MIIDYDIYKNFQCYINNTIVQFDKALQFDSEQKFKYGFIFTSIALELGFALVAKDCLR